MGCGVTEILGSIGECSFDSGSDKAHPAGFEFAGYYVVAASSTTIHD